MAHGLPVMIAECLEVYIFLVRGPGLVLVSTALSLGGRSANHAGSRGDCDCQKPERMFRILS